jgi:hypothetical protein
MIEGENRLYDLIADPGQERPLADPALEHRMVVTMTGLMRDNHAPPEAFARLGLGA